jgi:hypothetical protein
MDSAPADILEVDPPANDALLAWLVRGALGRNFPSCFRRPRSGYLGLSRKTLRQDGGNGWRAGK